MANPPHVPTEKSRGMAQGLAGSGIEQAAIAAELGISDRTLMSKHYKKELAAGTPRLIAKLAASLTRRALDPAGGMPSTVANIFMLKTRPLPAGTFYYEKCAIGAGNWRIHPPDSTRCPSNG